jgi:hypothetical protein
MLQLLWGEVLSTQCHGLTVPGGSANRSTGEKQARDELGASRATVYRRRQPGGVSPAGAAAGAGEQAHRDRTSTNIDSNARDGRAAR